MSDDTGAPRTLVRGLGLLGATSMTVAGVIGTGVFLKARVMTCNAGTPSLVVLAWIVTGVLSIAGALSYAELSAMMPEAGGEYVFIRRAYGRLAAFAFGWTRFFIACSGGAAALATGAAIFLNVVTGGVLEAHSLQPLGPSGPAISGIAAAGVLAIALATAINCASISVGGQVASAMAIGKVVLIVGLGVVAFAFGGGSWQHFSQSGLGGACEGVPASARGGVAGFGAAMLAALWAYNGWNETSYIAGETRDPRRILPLALIGGIGIVAAMYVFVNVAYAYVLPPMTIASLSRSSSVATEVLATFLGPAAIKAMAAVLVVSIFSALQVMTLLGARVPFAMAADGLLFKSLAHISETSRVPVRALIVQGVWSCVLVISGSFDTLTDYAMFAVLTFVGMATASVFVMRRRHPDAVRPYRTFGYPLTPALFLVVVAMVLVNTLVTAPIQALASLVIIALGMPFYWYWKRRGDDSELELGEQREVI